ncbi:unnamed protein product [Caenorhabditis auriculariae]|uniref:RING-type domain-containing protein n=1 Tax=Caenorhabditis auriculariae TaxID=2777116 RepID=A0A8S1GUD6_9PELO|nr:unnamed protein product [Caenorhabditis auriculariae]
MGSSAPSALQNTRTENRVPQRQAREGGETLPQADRGAATSRLTLTYCLVQFSLEFPAMDSQLLPRSRSSLSPPPLLSREDIEEVADSDDEPPQLTNSSFGPSFLLRNLSLEDKPIDSNVSKPSTSEAKTDERATGARSSFTRALSKSKHAQVGDPGPSSPLPSVRPPSQRRPSDSVLNFQNPPKLHVELRKFSGPPSRSSSESTAASKDSDQSVQNKVQQAANLPAAEVVLDVVPAPPTLAPVPQNGPPTPAPIPQIAPPAPAPIPQIALPAPAPMPQNAPILPRPSAAQSIAAPLRSIKPAVPIYAAVPTKAILPNLRPSSHNLQPSTSKMNETQSKLLSARWAPPRPPNKRPTCELLVSKVTDASTQSINDFLSNWRRISYSTADFFSAKRFVPKVCLYRAGLEESKLVAHMKLAPIRYLYKDETLMPETLPWISIKGLKPMENDASNIEGLRKTANELLKLEKSVLIPEFLCVICERPCNLPVRINGCLHRFCFACVDSHVSSKKASCPMCKTLIQYVLPDRPGEKMMDMLGIDLTITYPKAIFSSTTTKTTPATTQKPKFSELLFAKIEPRKNFSTAFFFQPYDRSARELRTEEGRAQILLNARNQRIIGCDSFGVPYVDPMSSFGGAGFDVDEVVQSHENGKCLIKALQGEDAKYVHDDEDEFLPAKKRLLLSSKKKPLKEPKKEVEILEEELKHVESVGPSEKKKTSVPFTMKTRGVRVNSFVKSYKPKGVIDEDKACDDEVRRIVSRKYKQQKKRPMMSEKQLTRELSNTALNFGNPTRLQPYKGDLSQKEFLTYIPDEANVGHVISYIRNHYSSRYPGLEYDVQLFHVDWTAKAKEINLILQPGEGGVPNDQGLPEKNREVLEKAQQKLDKKEQMRNRLRSEVQRAQKLKKEEEKTVEIAKSQTKQQNRAKTPAPSKIQQVNHVAPVREYETRKRTAEKAFGAEKKKNGAKKIIDTDVECVSHRYQNQPVPIKHPYGLRDAKSRRKPPKRFDEEIYETRKRTCTQKPKVLPTKKAKVAKAEQEMIKEIKQEIEDDYEICENKENDVKPPEETPRMEEKKIVVRDKQIYALELPKRPVLLDVTINQLRNWLHLRPGEILDLSYVVVTKNHIRINPAMEVEKPQNPETSKNVSLTPSIILPQISVPENPLSEMPEKDSDSHENADEMQPLLGEPVFICPSNKPGSVYTPIASKAPTITLLEMGPLSKLSAMLDRPEPFMGPMTPFAVNLKGVGQNFPKTGKNSSKRKRQEEKKKPVRMFPTTLDGNHVSSSKLRVRSVEKELRELSQPPPEQKKTDLLEGPEPKVFIPPGLGRKTMMTTPSVFKRF